ncbi:hypothetical protein, partial [Capnocytophaga sp. oral taxon 324]|uniref:hypothetical protein n=1 Tax=Capnocytophaga sp. oral taxon 324 TaxID=712211 RepID=UPI001E3F84EE
FHQNLSLPSSELLRFLSNPSTLPPFANFSSPAVLRLPVRLAPLPKLIISISGIIDIYPIF